MTQTPENQQQYGSILTVLGENAEQNGKLQNKQISFTHIAIGDSNDTYVQPDRSQTVLVNELARIPVNSVDVLQPTPDSVPMLKVEAILPDNVNDLIIREFAAVAEFNDQTYFHAVGNCARIYVPPPVNNGNVLTPVTLEMIFVITSAEPIIEIDPNVVTASREYVNKSVAKFNAGTVIEKLKESISSTFCFKGVDFIKNNKKGTPSTLLFTQTIAEAYDSAGNGFDIVTSKIFPAVIFGVNDGSYDCLPMLKYCAKQGKTFDFRGGGKYLLKYDGVDEFVIKRGDIANGFTLLGDDARIEEGNTVSSRFFIDFKAQKTALFHYSCYGFNIPDCVVESKNSGVGMLLKSDNGGPHYTEIGNITAINCYQLSSLQRTVYLDADSIQSFGCTKPPEFYNNMSDSESGEWTWNATDSNGWYNNVITINQLLVIGASESAKIVASDLTINMIDVSKNDLTKTNGIGVYQFGHPNYKWCGNIKINNFYDELNIGVDICPIFTVNNVFDFEVVSSNITEGKEATRLETWCKVINSKNVSLPAPKNYGYMRHVVHADNSFVDVVGNHLIGNIIGDYTVANGGAVNFEPNKPKQLLFTNIDLPVGADSVVIGEGFLDDECLYEVKGFQYYNGILSAFSLIVEPYSKQLVTKDTVIEFGISGNSLGKGTYLTARNPTELTLGISRMTTRAMTKYTTD